MGAGQPGERHYFRGPGRGKGRAVLVHTGWARRRGTDAYLEPDSPHLTATASPRLSGGMAAFPVRTVAVLPA